MGEGLAAQNQRISDNIRKHGWHCLHVFPITENKEKFSYSIGFGESYDADQGYDDIPADEPLAIV